jgi:hypothetical protein
MQEFCEGEGVRAQAHVSDSSCTSTFGFCAFGLSAFIEYICSYGPASAEVA